LLQRCKAMEGSSVCTVQPACLLHTPVDPNHQLWSSARAGWGGEQASTKVVVFPLSQQEGN
jgi:hypothetical protein